MDRPAREPNIGRCWVRRQRSRAGHTDFIRRELVVILVLFLKCRYEAGMMPLQSRLRWCLSPRSNIAIIIVQTHAAPRAITKRKGQKAATQQNSKKGTLNQEISSASKRQKSTYPGKSAQQATRIKPPDPDMRLPCRDDEMTRTRGCRGKAPWKLLAGVRASKPRAQPSAGIGPGRGAAAAPPARALAPDRASPAATTATKQLGKKTRRCNGRK